MFIYACLHCLQVNTVAPFISAAIATTFLVIAGDKSNPEPTELRAADSSLQETKMVSMAALEFGYWNKNAKPYKGYISCLETENREKKFVLNPVRVRVTQMFENQDCLSATCSWELCWQFLPAGHSLVVLAGWYWSDEEDSLAKPSST